VTIVRGGSRPSDSKASRRRRAAIIDATIDLLRIQESSEVSIADIAERAGVSVATVYNLVGPREQLLAAVLDAYVGRVSETLQADPGTPTGSDPAAVAVAVVTNTVLVVLADPIPLRTVLRELGPLHLADTKGASTGDLLEPALFTAGLDADAAAEAARLVNYAFRGALLTWAHGLISDHRFADDLALATRRIVDATVNAYTGPRHAP